MIKHSKYPRGKAPSHMMMALLTGASAITPAFAADAVAPVPAATAPAKSDEPTVAPVVVKAQRDTSKPSSETQYKTETTRVGKTDEAPKDIPQSITIVPAKLISDRGNDSLTSALQHVSGISFNSGEGGRIGDNLNLRGFISYGDIFLDGMRDIAQYNREVFNLERVEVLRGSASMLFGHGSSGGVINQVSKTPYLADENEASLSLGDWGYYRGTLDLNKVTGETSAFRLNTMYTNDSGLPQGADSKRFGIAPSFRWGIGTSDELGISYYHLNYDNTPNFAFPWVGGRPYDDASDKFYGLKSDYQTDSADLATVEYIHRFSNKTQVRSAFRYGEFKRDLWATQLSVVGSPVTGANTVNRASPPARGANDQDMFWQTDLTSRFDLFGMKHEALAGVEIGKESSDRFGYVGTPTNKPATTVGNPNTEAVIPTRYNMTRTNYNYFDAYTQGFYLQDNIEFIPNWKALIGGRFDRFYGDYKAGSMAAPTRYQREDNDWSYRLGLIWATTPNLNLYISQSTSFNTSGDAYSYDQVGANTPPEESLNQEIGAKWELFEGDLSLRAALFKSTKLHERSTDTATVAGAGNLLSGKRHTSGWELEATGHITKQLEIFANFAHMWSKVDAVGNAPNAQANLGQPAANTPTNSGSVWMIYDFVPNWSVGFGGDGQTRRNYAIGSTNYAPGFVKYDAMLAYEQPSYTIQLNANNLLDKIYHPQIYNGWAVAGPRRNFELTTTIRF
ncbi:TonB-dependent siderophore receptor [Uliginosibacterium sp. H3]|uniref:TonB-dependent siderophore receptor n=1 Tax=Uliginosibacterium silvisoli TaxID=3114758 RepID=A0ABU6K6Q7_9RHOO|nr:TonB-dependent siderophore receptor [Uliginosibacterium sp. H3]